MGLPKGRMEAFSDGLFAKVRQEYCSASKAVEIMVRLIINDDSAESIDGLAIEE